MTTPRERAEKIAQQWNLGPVIGGQIESAIRAAVVAERETMREALLSKVAEWERGSVDGCDRMLFVGDVGRAVRDILDTARAREQETK
jgi:hypothetical protein